MVKKSILVLSLLLMTGLVFSSCTTTTDNTSADTSSQIQKENGDKSETQIAQENLASMIEDGVYSETIYYGLPENKGKDEIRLDMTIEDGIIQSISLEKIEVNKESKKYVDKVDSALQKLVLGKNINEVELPNAISGSSLTTNALKNKLEELSNNA